MQLSVLITVLLPLVAVFNTGDATTGWSVPNIGTADGTGTLSFAEDKVIGTAGLATTFVATPATNQLIVSYELLTASTPFSLVGTTGELNLDTALDFETTATYTIKIKAVDDTTGTALSATATITITVTDVNEAPTFASAEYTMCLADASPAGTTLGTVLATDVDASTTLAHTIKAATGSTDFSIGSTTGVITVANGKTIVSATQSQYDLIIEVTDATIIATAELIVTVGCSSAATVAMGITTLLVALVAALQ